MEGRLELQWQSHRFLSEGSRIEGMTFVYKYCTNTKYRKCATGFRKLSLSLLRLHLRRLIKVDVVLVMLASRNHRPVLLTLHDSRQKTKSFARMHDLGKRVSKNPRREEKDTNLTLHSNHIILKRRLHINTMQRPRSPHGTPKSIIRDRKQSPSRAHVENRRYSTSVKRPRRIQVFS